MTPEKTFKFQMANTVRINEPTHFHAGSAVLLCEHLHSLFSNVKESMVNTSGPQSHLNRIDRRMVDVCRAVVTIDTIHYAPLGGRNLIRAQRRVTRLIDCDITVPVG